MTSGPVDFLIITALQDERDAMLTKFDTVEPVPKGEADLFTYYRAKVPTERAEQASYDVIVTQLLEMGPVHAAIQTATAVTRWQPRAVLLVGIAGGVEGVAELGDVLVAKQVVDYTLGKVEVVHVRKLRKKKSKGKKRVQAVRRRTIRWDSHRTDPSLYDTAIHLKEWASHVSEKRPHPGEPELRVGIVASGPNVVADGEHVEELKTAWPKLIGLEMEGGGVAAALHAAVSRPRFLLIKGVSDLADPRKGNRRMERWRAYACDVSASFARALLQSAPLVPASAASTGLAQSGADSTSTLLRERDLRSLEAFWESIPTDLLDLFFQRAVLDAIPDAVLFHVEGLLALRSSSSFHIFDERLRTAVAQFLDRFLSSATMTNFFEPTPSGHEFRFIPSHRYRDFGRWKVAHDQFHTVVREAAAAYQELIKLTRTEWSEIDLLKTNAAANREKAEFEARLAVLGDNEAETGETEDDETISNLDQVDKAKAALLKMAAAAANTFVGGSEDREIELALESDLDRRAAAELEQEGKAVVSGDSCRIWVRRR